MTSEPGPGPAVVSLRVALEATADALASARLDALLASEAGLAAATSGAAAVMGLPDLDSVARARLTDDLADARRALRRCQRLGASLTDFVRASLLAQGRAGAYDRSGQESSIASRHATLNTRG